MHFKEELGGVYGVCHGRKRIFESVFCHGKPEIVREPAGEYGDDIYQNSRKELVMNAETFSSGLAHKLFLAAEPKGWTPALMNQLAENPDLLGKFLEVLEGRSKIVPAPLVDFIGTVAGDLSATEPFDVEKHYAVDMAPDALVKIRYVNEFFKACLRPGRTGHGCGYDASLRRPLPRLEGRPDHHGTRRIPEGKGDPRGILRPHRGAGPRSEGRSVLCRGRANVIYVEDKSVAEDEQVAYTN